MPHKKVRNNHTTMKDKSNKNRFAFVGQNKIKKLDLHNNIDGLKQQREHREKVQKQNIQTYNKHLRDISKKIEDFKNFQQSINYQNYELVELKQARDNNKNQLDEITKLLTKYQKSKSDITKSSMINKMSELENSHKELLDIFYLSDKNYNFKKIEELETTLINLNHDEINKLLKIIDIVKTTDKKVTKNQYDTQEIKTKMRRLEYDLLNLSKNQNDRFNKLFTKISEILKKCNINTMFKKCTDDIENINENLEKIPSQIDITNEKFDAVKGTLQLIQDDNTKKQKTMSAEQQIIIEKMQALKMSEDIQYEVSTMTSIDDIRKLLKNEFDNGTITKFDYDRINFHTTNSKNEIMFDIVDMIIEIIGKKRFWKFLSYAPSIHSFVLTYEKYIKIILNTLIVVIIGGFVGGHLSSKYFSDKTNNMLTKINTTVSKTNKITLDINNIVINIEKSYTCKYDENRSLNIGFEELSTEILSITEILPISKKDFSHDKNLSKLVQKICENDTIEKVFIAGFATGAKIEKGKNINYDDNFDLSLARANTIKYMIYKHCTNIKGVDIVNLVREKSTDKKDQKAIVKFYTKKRGQ